MFWNVVLNLIGLYIAASFWTVAWWLLDLNRKGLLGRYSARCHTLLVFHLFAGPFVGSRLLWRRWRRVTGDAALAPYVPAVPTVCGLAFAQACAMLSYVLFAVFRA